MTAELDVKYNESSFTSRLDGKQIFYREWTPPAGSGPRAVVQITHGICEHSGRYDRFARYLSARGYAVAALDLRGHGRTAGEAGLGQAGLTAWADMLGDIAQLSNLALESYGGLPLIAFGHSMGSALTQAHIQACGHLLAGAVLCGTMGALPGIDDEVLGQLKAAAHSADANQPSAILADVLKAFNAPFEQAGRPPTGCEWMTADQTEVQRFLDDELCGKPFSNSMMYSVAEGFRNLWITQNESRIPIDLPILIVAGTRDPVGASTHSIQSLITRYMKQGHLALAYRFYPGDRHEILNDRNKDLVHYDIASWFGAVLNRR